MSRSYTPEFKKDALRYVKFTYKVNNYLVQSCYPCYYKLTS